MLDGPLVIVNPVAGGGRAATVARRLDADLREADAVVRWTAFAGDAEEIARTARADGRERVVVIGGDGTLQEVVNGLMGVTGDSMPVMGIVPCGRGNDLARSIGLPRSPSVAWRVAVAGGSGAVDVLHASGDHGTQRWFASAGGAGFDAQVAAAMSERQGWRRSAMGYAIATLNELRRYGNRPLRMTVDEGPPVERRALFVAVANGEYYGGGMRIAPGAEINDGSFDVCLVGDISRTEAVRWLPRLYRGTHLANRNVELLRGKSIRIESVEPTAVHLDGEPFGALPVRITAHPAVLHIAGARRVALVR